MFENPTRGRQARNFTQNVPKILDLKSSSEQIFSENWRWVPWMVLTGNLQLCSGWTYDGIGIATKPLDILKNSISFALSRLPVKFLYQTSHCPRFSIPAVLAEALALPSTASILLSFCQLRVVTKILSCLVNTKVGRESNSKGFFWFYFSSIHFESSQGPRS